MPKGLNPQLHLSPETAGNYRAQVCCGMSSPFPCEVCQVNSFHTNHFLFHLWAFAHTVPSSQKNLYLLLQMSSCPFFWSICITLMFKSSCNICLKINRGPRERVPCPWPPVLESPGCGHAVTRIHVFHT